RHTSFSRDWSSDVCSSDLADMLHQQLVEAGYRGVAIRLLHQLHFPQHEGMATDRALAEDHQVAREDVGALHGDGDRRRQPQTAEVVVRAQDDAFTAMDVHGIGDRSEERRVGKEWRWWWGR